MPPSRFLPSLLLCAALGAPAAAGAQGPPPEQPAPPPAAELAAAPRVSASELRALAGRERGLVILDVRASAVGASIAGAAHVPLAKLAEWAGDRPRDTPIVCYCACADESLSAAAVVRLRGLGFTDVRALRGGLQAWIDLGFPVTTSRR